MAKCKKKSKDRRCKVKVTPKWQWCLPWALVWCRKVNNNKNCKCNNRNNNKGQIRQLWNRGIEGSLCRKISMIIKWASPLKKLDNCHLLKIIKVTVKWINQSFYKPRITKSSVHSRYKSYRHQRETRCLNGSEVLRLILLRMMN